ncbi:MAG: HDOD domain-containing protein [bacterium]
MIETEHILDKVKSVPPLSPGATRLLSIMGKQNRSLKEVSQTVMADGALTANILKVVNSAAFNLSREIANVEEAIVYLGDMKIMAIAMANSDGAAYNSELHGYEGTRGELGRHCLWTGLAARELAGRAKPVVDPGLAFTSGILHDIGKAVISDFLVGTASDIISNLENDDSVDYIQAENHLLGTDHCEVGAELSRRWQLPESLRPGIRYHHTPAAAAAEDRPLAYIVHLADMLAMMQGYGTGCDALQYKLDDNYREFIRLESRELEEIVLKLQLEFSAIASTLFDGGQGSET